MLSDTNNLLERFFRSMKRDYLNGQRAKRRDALILVFLNQANGFHAQSLKSKLRNSEISETERLQKKYEDGVLICRRNAKAVDTMYNTTLDVQTGLVVRMFSHDGIVHYTCMGDFSCTCNENEDDICMHVESLLHGEDGQLLLCIDHILETARMIKRALQLDRPQVQKMCPSEQDSTGSELYECWPASFYVKQEYPPPKTRRLPFYANKTDNICSCHCYRLLSTCPHLIALGVSNEVSLREIVTEVRGRVSIRRNNKVNQEWVQMLRLKLELTPTGQSNVELPTTDDESQHLERKKHNMALLVDQWRSLRREFEKLPQEAQMQFLEEDMMNAVTRVKRLKDASSSRPSSHASRSRAFDPSERNFHTQLRFPRGTSVRDSGNGSGHLGTQQLDYLAGFAQNTHETNSMDIDAIPSPGEVITSPPPAPAGRHVNAVLRDFRAPLQDDEQNR